jgi:hypothetical protein
MNERIKELVDQATKRYEPDWNGAPAYEDFDKEKFARLIVQECNRAVLEVPLYYKDYRSQIEESVIRDCARAVLEKFGVAQ